VARFSVFKKDKGASNTSNFLISSTNKTMVPLSLDDGHTIDVMAMNMRASNFMPGFLVCERSTVLPWSKNTSCLK
jgi:hypothetical protein